MKASSAPIHATRSSPNSEEKAGFIPGVATATTEATVIGTATTAPNAGPARGKAAERHPAVDGVDEDPSPINPTPANAAEERRRLRSLR